MELENYSAVTEDTLNSVSVTCEIVGSRDADGDPKTKTRTDDDLCEVCPTLEVTKEVSCDGGDTWSTDCIGWDNDPEVRVRYTANTSGGTLGDCLLMASNGEILADPVIAAGGPARGSPATRNPKRPRSHFIQLYSERML